MVDVLLILDGATDAPYRAPGRGCAGDERAALASIERARTPAYDRLRGEGRFDWVTLLPDGVPVGSETAISALLGWVPDGPVDRAAVEAAARELEIGPGERAWRIDVGERPHRRKLLIAGTTTPPRLWSDAPVRVWPTGALPPRILDESTVVIGAAGVATGLARLMGARAVIPPGATGRPGSDLAAKRDAALAQISAGTPRVVVHVGGADEAAHERDPKLKVAVLEEADRELTGPLAAAVGATGGSLRICADHGCDPVTGEHVAGAVPNVTWSV